MGGTKPRVHYSPSPSSPDVVTHVANQNLPQDLDGYCNYIESVYLKHCDPKIPMHFFALMMTRQALCKLRIIDFMCRGISSESLEQPERDALFAEAIHVVEYDSMLLSNDSLGGFSWYMQMHFPLPAYIFLVSELRARKTGELCERAWEVMLENHERRGLMRNLRSPMHIAFGSMFVKAWDAREAAEAQMGNQLQAPKLITLLRAHMARVHPKRGAAAGPCAAGPGQGNMGGTNGGNSSGGAGYAQQQQQQAGSSGTSSSSPSVGLAASAAAYAGNKAMPEAPMVPGTEAMGGGAGGGMSLDGGNMLFSGFDSVNPLFGAAVIPDADFQMDWSHYMMQFGGYSGFGGSAPGGWPVAAPHPSTNTGG
jgi:hypothetical protein